MNSTIPLSENASALQTLDRGIEILQLLSEAPHSVEELSRLLRCPRSTAYRALTTLRRRHLVDRDGQTARYTLGFGILRLARAFLGLLPIREVAMSTMRQISEQVGETAVLTVRRGAFGVTIETIETSDPVRVAPAQGESVPLHCGAPMKAILAFLPPEQIDAYLRRPLVQLTPRTIVDAKRLRKHLAEIREQGYADSSEEVYPKAVGVAVPVLGIEGYAVASLGIAGPVHRLPSDRVEQIAELLLRAGRELNRRIQAGIHSEAHPQGKERREAGA